MDYLARYHKGEYSQVWDELIKLGPEIRQGDLYSQAEGVARETMRRVKTNLTSLVERLKTLDYKFKYEPVTPPEKGRKREIRAFQKIYGPLPLSLEVFYEEVGQVNFMGSHPKLSEYVKSPGLDSLSQNFLSLYQKHLGPAPEDKNTASPNQSLALGFQLLQELAGNSVTKGDPSRLEKLGAFSKDLASTYSLQIGPSQPAKPVPAQPEAKKSSEKPDVLSDPLVIEFDLFDTDIDPEELEDSDYKDPETGLYRLEVAPDPLHKANYSGGGPAEFLIPNYSIDGELRVDGVVSGYFVNYLRECLQWGGFPGLKDSKQPPTKEIQFLTKDLLPF